MSLDLALMIFDHVEGAERAYSDVIGASRDAPWVHEIAFVEHHRHDRIVVRGTFAGRYLDLDDQGDVIGKRTTEGALTGAVAGAFFGPAGFAAGLVAGGTAGGLSEASKACSDVTGVPASVRISATASEACSLVPHPTVWWGPLPFSSRASAAVSEVVAICSSRSGCDSIISCITHGGAARSSGYPSVSQSGIWVMAGDCTRLPRRPAGRRGGWCAGATRRVPPRRASRHVPFSYGRGALKPTTPAGPPG